MDSPEGHKIKTNGVSGRTYTCRVSATPYFVVNPLAANGRAARWWRYALPVLRKEWPDLKYARTDALHSLDRCVAEAAAAGARLLVGVGGDGTHHDIVNALVNQQLLDLITYAPLPLGTGNDWCRTLEVPRHLLRWIGVFRRDRVIDHRIGKLTYGPEGSVRHFINVAGLAYDAHVVRRSETLGQKHRLLYPALTVAYLGTFTPPALELRYGDQVVSDRFHTINFGIGRYNGGGMRLVPQANPTADTLALTYATALPLTRILANGWRFFTPTIGRVEGVTTTHATAVTVTGVTGLEADGEYLGTGPVRAELIGQRLRVRCGLPE